MAETTHARPEVADREAGLSTQAEIDRANKQEVFPDVQELLSATAPLTDKSILRMMKDIRRLGKGPGQLKYVEYFRWRLYEQSRGEQNTFLSEWQHWPVERACNDQDAAKTTVAKWECTDILEREGIVTIPVLAMIDQTDTDYGATPRLADATSLMSFLADAPLPLFAKPNALLGSFGAFIIDRVDGDTVTLSDGRVFSGEALLHHLIGDEAYLLQEVVHNHSAIRAWAPNLATMRTMNFMCPDGPITPFVIYKIPCNGNIADNFWRTGNLLAEIDVASGEIVRVVRGAGAEQEALTHHPDTGHAMTGTFIPHWDEAMELNRATVHRFPAVRYCTLDLSVTDAGPVVVEVNAGGSFDLPQVATGRGILEPAVKDFISSCGYRFGA